MNPVHRATLCGNMNHRRADAPLRHCIQCGAMVNARASARPCDDAVHAVRRRERAEFCVDCGAQLVVRH